MCKITNTEAMFLVEQSLTEKYEIRYNLLSKKKEVRVRTEEGFRPLNEMMTNSIIRQIRRELEEVSNPKMHVLEFLNSEDIQQYDPIRDYVNQLPKWDGENRVAELFTRIPGITSEQIYWCSVWLRSALAHWMGMDTLHGNECVPTLIGAQGSGKSTFCHRLLPPHLRVYFLDHINLGNKNDKEMALTNNLLVNLDELDQVKPSQQAELKQTLSKVKVNGRPIYGREQNDRVRYASFVATTNNPHPLQDPTGSRRYLCVRIPDGCLVDNESDIDYDQLYAQVREEVMERKMRYWFTNDEVEQIQRANAQFQQEQDLESMLDTCFRLPKEEEHARELSVKEIIHILTQQFPLLKSTRSLSTCIGLKLKDLGFQKKDSRKGMRYQVIPVRV